MFTPAVRATLLPMGSGAALALAFFFDLAENLPTPFVGHLLVAAGFFALAASLQYGFLVELSEDPQSSYPLARVLDGGLAMFVWSLGALSLVHALCVLVPAGALQ